MVEIRNRQAAQASGHKVLKLDTHHFLFLVDIFFTQGHLVLGAPTWDAYLRGSVYEQGKIIKPSTHQSGKHILHH